MKDAYQRRKLPFPAMLCITTRTAWLRTDAIHLLYGPINQAHWKAINLLDATVAKPLLIKKAFYGSAVQ